MEVVMVAAVLLFLYVAFSRQQSVSYVCPQCGSRNGDHGKDCSWRP